jgi:hypothetical protein
MPIASTIDFFKQGLDNHLFFNLAGINTPAMQADNLAGGKYPKQRASAVRRGKEEMFAAIVWEKYQSWFSAHVLQIMQLLFFLSPTQAASFPAPPVLPVVSAKNTCHYNAFAACSYSRINSQQYIFY